MSHRTYRPAALLVAILVMAASSGAQEQKEYKTVDPGEFEKLINQKKDDAPIILDVRTPEEYKAAHLKDAVLIDYKAKDFDQKIKALDKSKTYLIYCASGYRSSSACKKLQALDIPNLYNLKGGITAWQKAGKPTEK
jgi:rhodanese-related sulfurtransferase